jgi:hypothetical protein
MEVSGEFHDPVALIPGQEPRYALDRRMGGPQSRSGRGGEEKSIQSLPLQGTENRSSSSLIL